jgi:hypothetical protein
VSPPSATISAPVVTILVGASATLTGSVSGEQVWTVNGVPGGSVRFGTVTSAGVYTAPLDVPTGNPVTIRVASAAAPGDSASLPLTIVPSTAAGSWTAWQPRIVNAARSDSVALLVHVPPEVTRVELAPAGGAPPRTFRDLGHQLYQIDLSRAQALGGYVTGDYHNFVGFIDYYAGSTRLMRGNSFVSVRDGTMPDAPVTSLAADAAATTRVLNVRIDDVPAEGVSDALATQRLYQLFPDAYDFVAVVQPVAYYQNRYYDGVRNATTGIGVGTFDAGAAYGSASHLQGIVHYPIDGFFDLGESAAVHEIGHRWINFLFNTPLAGGSPHWPVSTLASSVMGFNIPGSNVGGNFHFVFQPNGDGTFQVLAAPDTGRFYDLELYLMGLLPSDSVGPHFVFQNQAQFPLAIGANAAGPVTAITVDDIIAAHGPRVPAYGSAQTTFRIATVVVSTGVLLPADALAFFEHMAARGEATTRLRFTSGFASGMSRPFYVATGGRGRLATSLR